MKKQLVLAISGVKNTGKTTFISALIPLLTARGYRVAVIKHDGHDFEPDRPGTDSWRCLQSGAYGAAVFSANRFSMVKEQSQPDPDMLIRQFPEADFLLLEGFKHSRWPKLELIRRKCGVTGMADPETVLGVVTDLEKEELEPALQEKVFFHYEETGRIADYVCKLRENLQTT